MNVEPVQMPFVWSALAKLHALQPTATTAWALARCALSALRADALVALARAPEAESPQPPSGDAPSLLNAASVLRSGHAPEDLALAMGLSRSPMGHVPCDNGSLVLGTAGRWWPDDPGYQQYLRTAERAFTLGSSLHNAPVINGEPQRYKRPTLLSATRLSDAPEVPFALVDLTACYPPEAAVSQVWRAVWLIGCAQLLVCDQVQGAAPLQVAYHWHGHPELSWCIQQDEALLASAEQPERLLRISSPQCPLEPADLDRLPGSRGPLALSVSLSPAPGEPLWWLFSFAEKRPPLSFEGQTLCLGEQRFALDARLSVCCEPIPRTWASAPLLVTAKREGAICGTAFWNRLPEGCTLIRVHSQTINPDENLCRYLGLRWLIRP